MQEDQRTVRSTLNAISGGLSFRTGSIHPDASRPTTDIKIDFLLLRWKSIAAIRSLTEKTLIDELAQDANALVTTDLKEPGRSLTKDLPGQQEVTFVRPQRKRKG